MTEALDEQFQAAAVLMDYCDAQTDAQTFFYLQLYVNKDVICSMGVAVHLGNASKSACLSIFGVFLSVDLSGIFCVCCYFLKVYSKMEKKIYMIV